MEYDDPEILKKIEEGIFVTPTNWWNLVHNPEKCKDLATSSHDGQKATPDDWFETWEEIQKLGDK